MDVAACKTHDLNLRMSLIRDTFDVPVGLRMVLLPMDPRYVVQRSALDESGTRILESRFVAVGSSWTQDSISHRWSAEHGPGGQQKLSGADLATADHGGHLVVHFDRGHHWAPWYS